MSEEEDFFQDVEFNEIEEETISDKREEYRAIIENKCRPFRIEFKDLMKIKKLMLDDIEMALCQKGQHEADMKCTPTYVQHLPTGCERGSYLSLDFGARQFYVAHINVKPDEEIHVEYEIFEIPEILATGLGRNLFDYIAECLSIFLHKREIAKENYDLGFTFSFPYRQIDLRKGILQKWSNGIDCEDVIGVDIMFLLRDSIQRRKDIHIRDIVLLNNTTTMLVACAYHDKKTKISMIVDKELHACYLEKMKYIDTMKMDFTLPPTMVMNLQLSTFGDKGALDFIYTTFDQQVDETLINTGLQKFEKMTSDLYWGELVRFVLLTCIEAGALFAGHVSERISQANSFKNKYVSQILNEPPGKYIILKEILEILGYKDVSDDDYANVRYICTQIAKRSAYLVAVGIACCIDRIGDTLVSVAIDGSVYKSHPCYGEQVKRKIRQLALPEHKFEIVQPEDKFIGAAALLCAALAHKKQKP